VGFNADHVWGTYFLGLPIEEWLFFVCVPYACVFTYHCLLVLGVKDFLGSHAHMISTVLILGFWPQQAGTGSVHTPAWLVPFAPCGSVFTAFVQKAPWLGRFYFAYLVLLVPFMLVKRTVDRDRS
jgi:hypothetical protein